MRYLSLLLASICVMFSVIAYGSVPKVGAPDITGLYYCKGYDPFVKSNYSGFMDIKKTGQTYSYRWVYGEEWKNYGKALTYMGTGIMSPDNNYAVIAYLNTGNKNEIGLLSYKIENDNSLVGHWTLIGKDTIAIEYCSKAKSMDDEEE